ncbi:MAG: hypothetical protein JSU63_16300 [Phycisphaerales bacterium]|nr:MAG: hypothetical protein JSU63_16300 [Phycisphaerales bacterium]
MPRKTTLIALILTLAVFADRAVADGEIRWMPVRVWNPSSWQDNVICMPGEGVCGDTETILWDGGVTVTLFMQLRGWNPDGDRALGAFQGTLDHATLQGGHPSGIDTLPGLDLVPYGADMGWEWNAAFMALKICSPLANPCTDRFTDWLSDCRGDPAVCGLFPPNIRCLDRFDYVFFDIDHISFVSTAFDNYFWGAASLDCQPEDNPQDCTAQFPGWWYGGTLRLEVPEGAVGTYSIDFIADPEWTLLNDCQGIHIEDVTRTPAAITIVPGATDCNHNGFPDSVDLAEGTSPDCNGNDIPDECESDSDGDGAIDPCDTCADYNDDDDSDGDGVPDGCDGCPQDPNKIEAGQCGCGVSDPLFGSDCTDAIPTASAWGLAVLALLLLTVGKIAFRRRRRLSNA